MKILILANHDVGLYKFRKELIEGLLERGHELFLSIPGGPVVPSFTDMGCRFIDTPLDRRGMNPLKDLSLLVRYRKIIREVQPDLVVAYTIKPNIYGGIAARVLRKQYAVNITGLGTAFETPGPVRTAVTALYRFALKKAKVIFFENAADRDLFVQLRLCEKERTVVLHGAGVNTDVFTCQPYPDNPVFRFLFIGRVMREKGIGEICQAMERLNKDSLVCTLDVAGDMEEDYGEKLRSYEALGWLRYHGFQDDVRPLIRDCDCFVLPSYHEGMANTNLECASSGRPVITSNIPGCREAVIDGVSGFLCEPRDAGSVFDAMDRMIRLPGEERAKMGQAGRKHMEEVFCKKAVVAQTLDHLLAGL